jgi:hypothetical protein
MRIPFGIKDNDSVSGCQINSQSTGGSAEKENVVVGVIELVN